MLKLIKDTRASFTIETILHMQIVFFLFVIFVVIYLNYFKLTVEKYEKDKKDRQSISKNVDVIRTTDFIMIEFLGGKSDE